MEYDPKDNEVVHLLKKLKESNGTYPPEMLALRRQGYIKQVAQVSAGPGLAMGLNNIARGGKGVAGMPPVAGTIIEALLVIAIVSEAAAVTYFYRDKLVQYYRSITNAPRVEQVASPPAGSEGLRRDSDADDEGRNHGSCPLFFVSSAESVGPLRTPVAKNPYRKGDSASRPS